MQCSNCKLSEYRTNIVTTRCINFIDKIDICFVGEAPGMSEDVIGSPFVGVAGKFFETNLINKIYDVKKYSMAFTNIIMCRPTDKIGGENREPTKTEIKSCKDNFLNVLNELKPEIVVFLGIISKNAYLNLLKRKYICYYIIHPSALLQTGGVNSPYYLRALRQTKEIFYAINSSR